MQINQPVTIDINTADGVLVAKTIDGDDLAFEILIRRYNRLLFRTARSIVKNDTEAEDILQEAYIRAWQSLDKFRAEAKLSTWLVRIVINEALGRLRRNKIEFLELDKFMDPENENNLYDLQDDNRPEPQVLNKQIRKQIENGIDQIPDPFRTVFVLRAVEELSSEEVAHILGIPQNTVRTRFFRARKMLQEILNTDHEINPTEAFSFDGARCDRIVTNVLKRKNAMI